MIGTEAVREAASGDSTAPVRERLARGKHRTEVTEAIEGGMIGTEAVREAALGHATASVRE
jgi:hypothetical protein